MDTDKFKIGQPVTFGANVKQFPMYDVPKGVNTPSRASVVLGASPNPIITNIRDNGILDIEYNDENGNRFALGTKPENVIVFTSWKERYQK